MRAKDRIGIQCLALLVALAGMGSLEAGSVDLAFSTLSPCRIIDTRLAGGAIGGNATRDFKVKGTSSLAGQGGSASGCGVPSDATGAMINFVAVNPAGAGYLTAWAYPVANPPLAATLNFGVIGGVPALANGLAVPICDASQSSCTYDLRIRAGVSATHVVADVVGYFREPVPAPATCVTPPCSVAICSDGVAPTCTLGTISSSSGPCTAVSQTGTCRGGNSCRVCQGPAVPASSSAVCSDSTPPSCSIASIASVSAACSATAAGGVCRGTSSCRICQTQ